MNKLKIEREPRGGGSSRKNELIILTKISLQPDDQKELMEKINDKERGRCRKDD